MVGVVVIAQFGNSKNLKDAMFALQVRRGIDCKLQRTAGGVCSLLINQHARVLWLCFFATYYRR